MEKDHDYFLNSHKDVVYNYDNEYKAQKLPPAIFDFFAVIDTAQNGQLDAVELDEAADIIRTAKKAKANNSAELNYKHMPEAVAKVLSTWDADKSGSVGISELVLAAEAQKKMQNENRLIKKLLVGAIIVIIILMAGTFALSLTAAEMAKETQADEDSGVIKTKSGKPAAMASSVDHVALVDFPSLEVYKLKEMRDFSLVHQGVWHNYMLAEFRWHSATKMELVATSGSVVTIDNGQVMLQKPNGQVEMIDPNAGRRLMAERELARRGAFLSTSGSFTLSSGGASRGGI